MKTSYRYCSECKSLHDASAWPHQAEAAEPKYDPSANYDEYMQGPRSGTFLRCKACGDFHEVSNWPDNHMPEQFDLETELNVCRNFISDNLESIGGLNGIQSMADGKFYTSKAKLRADYRARGMIEMGNDKAKPISKPKPDRRKIKEAVQKAWNVVHNEGGTAANYRARNKAKTVFGTVAK